MVAPLTARGRSTPRSPRLRSHDRPALFSDEVRFFHRSAAQVADAIHSTLFRGEWKTPSPGAARRMTEPPDSHHGLPGRGMRRTTLGALLAAAAVGGWIALFERGEPESDEEPVFRVAEEEVLAVEIRRSGDPAVRVSRAEGGFAVAEGGGPPAPADATEVDLLLQNVASLRFEREVPGDDLAAFGLDPPGLEVRIETGAGSAVAGFGDETPAPGNRYLRLGDRVLVTQAFARDNFDKRAWDLRDKRVFRLESPAARRLRLTAGGRAVEMARQDGVWTILSPYRFAADPYEASQLAARLLDAEMSGLATDGPFGLDTPRLVAELELLVGPEERAVSHTIRFGKDSLSPPGVFARLASDPLVFVVGRALVEELLRSHEEELASLRSLRLFRFAAFRAVELRIGAPDGETVFRRRDGDEGREWIMESTGADAAPADSATVEDLLYELNSADAEGVGGETLPAAGDYWTITVTEEGGGEPESVRIAVSGAGGAEALRAADERALLLGAEVWKEIAGRITAARSAPES